jgi:hypothetical protein
MEICALVFVDGLLRRIMKLIQVLTIEIIKSRQAKHAMWRTQNIKQSWTLYSLKTASLFLWSRISFR